MAVKPCSLKIDIRNHESDNRGTPMFPCGGYITEVGGNINNQLPWHWHEEIEIMIVACGTLKLDAPDHAILLKQGEAAFINSNVLHSAASTDNSVCEVKSFVFDPKLVFGFLESAIEQKYVRPLINCPRLCVIHFQNIIQWHREVIECIEMAYDYYQNEPFGHELIVRDCLSRLWFLIVSNYQAELEQYQTSKNTEAIRVKEMLGYIHSHYAEPINLKSIADSAAISERESLRCFNKILGTTPMKYLLGYRISIAAGLLTNSELNISEICRSSGFDSPSYFSLKFRSLVNQTPSEYKKQNKKSKRLAYKHRFGVRI